MKVKKTHDSNHPIYAQHFLQTRQELHGEKIDRFRASGEDIVDDVVVSFLMPVSINEDNGVFDYGGVVGW